ncbi:MULTISPECIES: ABC transporter permease [Paenibacillus]|uniref:ABC transporter permease n=1 Tax=Paenibacillus albilobatus TaxID=2716884 RepID=A0A919XN20_9BACL|nr:MULTISPECIES: ABC transporter permease [Paenibacillus]GIO33810.1 ABC transporter permease [Paenibacillus albilobatus]
MDLMKLRAERRSRFWGKEVLPYLGYVFQSGVAVLFMFALIAFSAWYTAFVQHLPAGLPIRWIMLVLLVPLTVNSSFRTYLVPADSVFLLPQESRMASYFKGSWIGGVVYKLLVLAIIFLILWPLYVRSDVNPKSFWLFLIVLVGLKLLASHGCWKELRMVSRKAALAYRLLRYVALALSVAAWMWQPAGRSLIFIALLAVTYLAALRIPAKHPVAWERLIAQEKVQVGRVLMILGWFVNVPGREQRVYARKWLSWAGNGIPWKPETAYRYLLVKSFVRSDILGIVLRVGILAAFLAWWQRGGIVGSVIYLFFVFLAGVQLSSLLRFHSESFWLHVYPIAPGSRRSNAVKLAFQIQLLFAAVTWLPLLGAGPGRFGAVFMTLAGGIVLCLLFRFFANRKKASDDEDED